MLTGEVERGFRAYWLGLKGTFRLFEDLAPVEVVEGLA